MRRWFASLALVAAVAGADDRAPDYDRALRISQAAIGRAVSAVPLLDQHRQPIALDRLQGKPLVISYVYTGCFQVCPTATRFLMDAVRDARAALGAESFRVLTIGFNQPFDSPEAMGAFARQNGIRDPLWLFASGAGPAVATLLSELGFTYYPTAKGFDHLMQVTVLDAEGKVYRHIYGETFDLPMLVGPLKELLTGQAAAEGGLDALIRRVKLFCTVYDPVSGGYRLNYSLFVEIGAGLSFLLAVLAWLSRARWRGPRAS